MSTPPFIEATRRMVRGKLGRIVSGDHGLRQVYSLIPGGTASAQSFTLTATDQAGNVSTATTTISPCGAAGPSKPCSPTADRTRRPTAG